jgi:ABC-type transport system involved in cytochrome c biogenesis permease component
MKRPGWLVGVIILWALLGALTTFTAMFVAFLFDAPGSEQNGYLVDAAIGLVGLPVSFFLGAALAAFLKAPGLRLIALALPLIPTSVTVYGFAMISSICGGQFRCP